MPNKTLSVKIDDRISGVCPACPSPDLSFKLDSIAWTNIGRDAEGKIAEQKYVITCSHESVCRYRVAAKDKGNR